MVGHVARRGRREICTKFWPESLQGRRHSEDLGLDRSIRKDLREIGCEGVDWIHLAQDKDKWQVLVNTAMNFRVP
jgi:hypothetical protein